MATAYKYYLLEDMTTSRRNGNSIQVLLKEMTTSRRNGNSIQVLLKEMTTRRRNGNSIQVLSEEMTTSRRNGNSILLEEMTRRRGVKQQQNTASVLLTSTPLFSVVDPNTLHVNPDLIWIRKRIRIFTASHSCIKNVEENPY